MFQKIKRRPLFLLVISLFISFGAYHFFVVRGIGEYVLSYGAYPILVLHNRVIDPLTTWIQKKQSLRLLEEQLVCKQKECETLLAQTIELRAQLSYVQDIKALDEFKQRYHLEDAHIAQVLARHLSERAHYMFINVGSRQGIEQDMTVIHNNCLLGKVTQVYPWYSKVTLITDRTCKVAALCAKTKAQGIAAGKNNEDTLTLKYVSHLAQVEDNDVVLSSGEGMVFPQGFALGVVCNVQPDGLYQRVAIAPVFDLREIRYCIVLPKGVIKKDLEPQNPDEQPQNLAKLQKNDQLTA